MSTPTQLEPTQLKKEVERRRTFAIISHPDAGKTTLTEKLLLYGGAIHLAGAVKAKKNQRNTTSDWMELEKQRGISISASVLQFDYDGYRINLLDTPGHKDFSEDTYRTLVAADAAVMLMDAAKGVEPQTRKLFEVCRMRGLPIFTFINKMDRPCREPLDLMDELEKVLGIRSCPMTWPLGRGDQFRGVLDRTTQEVLLFQTEGEANVKGRLEAKTVKSAQDPYLKELLQDDYEGFQAELELVDIAGDPYDQQRVLRGELTPVFFGSAMNNFGVERFLQAFIQMAPAPFARAQRPTTDPFSGFVFKIQANMDPAHRDRVAFMRVCSGRFERQMSVRHGRLQKDIKLAMPVQFFGQERVVVEEAWPGDIVGVIDTTSSLRIGDSIFSGKPVAFEPVPSFSPEHFATVLILDPMKRKQLKKGLDQLSEEGVVQVYTVPDQGDRDPVLGAVGALQFEVLQFRLKSEYGVDVRVERAGFQHARWARLKAGGSPTAARMQQLNREDSRYVLDRDGKGVVLFKSDWALRWTQENAPDLEFTTSAT